MFKVAVPGLTTINLINLYKPHKPHKHLISLLNEKSSWSFFYLTHSVLPVCIVAIVAEKL